MKVLDKLKNKFSSFFNNNIIGLDIGDSLIKLVEVESKQDKIQLNNLAITPTPSEAVEEGKLKDIDALSEQIKSLLEDNEFQVDQAVTAVSGEEVIIRTVEVPNMPEDELDEVIRWEAQEQIPISVDEAILDYEIVTRKPNGGYELMLVAVAKDLIDRYIDLFANLGLKLAAIEIEPTAAARVVHQLYPTQTIGLIDIGAGTTDVSIFGNGELIFTRTIRMAGDEITEEIMENYDLSFEEAEEYKRNNNLFEDAKLNVLIRNLTTAIYRSLDYFQVQYKDYNVDQLVLTGGESKLTGFISHLENEFEVTTEKLDLISSIESKVEGLSRSELLEVMPFLSVGIGLGLREVKGND
ncbi:type IV pilus assembly protein PilM [Acetohalobium arabaticum]|uniref:Type IV pilus assembly protein PilM n=1 Tax=Acetohalobium arabaticum (strain ATCC 49924 / DSM 5501 / Z-7288) TaxID=574087 RepID=D9QRX7_ACEAZ|nr:type IV pilus assembly protein PilM [Acetohalobium arabaticum]ADL13268.1 type IV pilus assembly protein PilM [Acetohalobium arabaticum DSM 5501]